MYTPQSYLKAHMHALEITPTKIEAQLSAITKRLAVRRASTEDIDQWQTFVTLVQGAQYAEALNTAQSWDTAMRENISAAIWIKIGGELLVGNQEHPLVKLAHALPTFVAADKLTRELHGELDPVSALQIYPLISQQADILQKLKALAEAHTTTTPREESC